VNLITHTYTYDGLNRLVSAVGAPISPGTNSYTHTYEYDAIGNITYKSDVGSYYYDYTNKPHSVRSTTGLANITFQYDANGNMTSKTVTQGPGKTLSSIVWNEDNKPVTIIANGVSVTFMYDGNGNRVRKIKGSNTTYYYGDAYEKRNTVGIIHLFANHQRLASIRTDGKNQYYHGNHLGSASVITDQNGNLKQKIEYMPYGTYRYGTSPNQQMGTYDYDTTFPNANYTFTDQEDDDETGLYNYKARLYDPQIGRFISADSIVPNPDDLQSLNRYSYCLNNPLIYKDPSGHTETYFGHGRAQHTASTLLGRPDPSEDARANRAVDKDTFNPSAYEQGKHNIRGEIDGKIVSEEKFQEIRSGIVEGYLKNDDLPGLCHLYQDDTHENKPLPDSLFGWISHLVSDVKNATKQDKIVADCLKAQDDIQKYKQDKLDIENHTQPNPNVENQQQGNPDKSGNGANESVISPGDVPGSSSDRPDDYD
jgi:RHS repeat-associated protein